MSLRSTTTFSSGQIYCCFTRTLSVRCSMLNEMPLLRAPENKRTGMEMRPKVKCPDQTEAAIVSSLAHAGLHLRSRFCRCDQVEEPAVSLGNPVPGPRKPLKLPRIASLAYNRTFGCTNLRAGRTEMRSRRGWGLAGGSPRGCS